MNTIEFNKIIIQPIFAGWLQSKNILLDVARFDMMHPLISGNKFFKLKHYLADAKQNNFDTIATFGGAYSNHIAATAYACKSSGFKCFAIIRGEEPTHYSPTLLLAKKNGASLFCIKKRV